MKLLPLFVLTLLLAGGPARAQSAPLPPGASGTATPETPKQVQPLAPGAPLADAETKLDEKDYAGAQALLAPYVAAHPADARALFDLGYLEDAQNHPSLAEADYRRALAADPRQFESHLALGLLLASHVQASPAAAVEARSELEAATRLAPDPPNPAAQAQADRALAQLLHATDPEAARQALLAALKLSPETREDTLLTAEIAEAAGDPQTAAEAYRGVLAAAPAGSESGSASGSESGNGSGSESGPALQATSGLAHLLIAGKQYTEAELLLRKALVRNAGDPVLNTQLASLLAAEGKQEDAAAVLENLHARLPDDRGIDRLLADLYAQGGDAAKADPLFVQLLTGPGASAPDEALLAARGDNLIHLKRFTDAIPVLQQAVHLDARDGNAWSSLAFAASVDHQPRLVLDALAARSKVMSETPATYFLAATSYDSLHETKRAVDMYKQFLAVAGGKFPDEEWQARHRLAALPR